MSVPELRNFVGGMSGKPRATLIEDEILVSAWIST